MEHGRVTRVKPACHRIIRLADTRMPDSKEIFGLQPFAHEFEPIYALIRRAMDSLDVSIRLFRLDEMYGESILEDLYKAIEESDLVVADLSHRNPNVMYELGYAHAVRKPVILIAQNTEYVPFDFKAVPGLIYDVERGHGKFVERLASLVGDALSNPERFTTRPTTAPSLNNVFVSYSHTDREFLQRLLVHLRPLEKEGLIDLWVDTKLEAGDKWKTEIERALRRSRVAVLLITADFLASDFIVNNELPPLLAKAESEGTRIIPVILKPCRFTRDKNLSPFQAINDPRKPLAMLEGPEQEFIYDRVSSAIEKSMVDGNLNDA